MTFQPLSRVPRLDGLALALLFVGVPLVLFPRMNEVFLLDKALVGCVALVLLLAGMGREGAARLSATPLFRLAAAYLVWMLGASLFTATAPGEVLPAAIPLLLFLGALSTAILSSTGERRKAQAFLKVGAWGVGLLGLGQAFGVDLGISWTATFDGRVFSTLGNPNYLAGYLSLLLPLSLVWVLEASTPGVRWANGALFVLLSSVFVLAAVRGAALALCFGVAAASLLALTRAEGRAWAKSRWRWIAAALAVGLLLGGLVMARQGGWDSFSLQGETARQRLETWGVAWRMVKDRPWVGAGLGQFKVLVPAYQWRGAPRDDAGAVTAPYTLTDHVHNEFLQVGVEGGAVGLLFFLAFWGFVFVSLARSGPWDPQVWARAAALAAVLGLSCSNFPLQLAPVAILAGWMAGLCGGRREDAAGWTPLGRVGWGTGAVLFVGMLWGAGSVALSVAQRDTVGETRLGSDQAAARYAGRLLAMPLPGYRALRSAGDALSQSGSMDSARSLEAYERSLRANPMDPETYLGVATLLYRAGRLDESFARAGEGIALAPNLHGLWFVRGSAAFQMGRPAEAEEAFARASRLGPSHFETWLNLGVARVAQGKKATAKEAWEMALSLKPGDPQATQYLGSVGKGR